ncbi:MAG: hypothetical protein ACYTBY_08145, partial [Planctomycetota bacterium]
MAVIAFIGQLKLNGLSLIGRQYRKKQENAKNMEVLSMKAPHLEKIDIQQVWSEYFKTRSESCRN